MCMLDRPLQLDNVSLTLFSMARCGTMLVTARHDPQCGYLHACTCTQLLRIWRSLHVCSLQTVAYNVDVFALAGAQDTAVSVQIPAFNIGTATDFDISFPHAVCHA